LRLGFRKRANRGRRREFAGKPKGMNKQTRKTELLDDGFMTAPGYPFSARDIFGDLRSRLAAEHRHPMKLRAIGQNARPVQKHHLQLV
jgi:hypothetical protein